MISKKQFLTYDESSDIFLFTADNSIEMQCENIKSAFTINSETFVPDLNTLIITGSDFGVYSSNSVNYVQFQLIANSTIKATHNNRYASNWQTGRLILHYPQKADLKDYYIGFVDTVRISIYLSTGSILVRLIANI